MQNKLNTCDLANNKVKDIIKNTKNPKFSNLHIWMKKQANFYYNENKNFGNKKTFHRYRRGTIVFVDFGTSIGAELCGYHFAVVLTKNDNPSNGSLTVIPFTSKRKSYNVSVGREIILDIMKDISKYLSDMTRLLDYYEDPQNSTLDEEEINELNNCVNVYKKLVLDNGYPVNSDLDVLVKVIDWLKEIHKAYKNNDKESFLMPSSITTISKFRIRLPINPLDPIGRALISDNALSVVDNEIVKRLVSDNLIIQESQSEK